MIFAPDAFVAHPVVWSLKSISFVPCLDFTIYLWLAFELVEAGLGLGPSLGLGCGLGLGFGLGLCCDLGFGLGLGYDIIFNLFRIIIQ